jgi:hypothetical protein
MTSPATMTKPERIAALRPTTQLLDKDIKHRKPVTGAEITRLCQERLPTDLWGAYRAQWVRAAALGVANQERRAAPSVQLSDPATGTQLHLWRFGNPPQVYGLNVLPLGCTEFTERYWVTPDHNGTVDHGELRASPAVPDRVRDLLGQSYPLPRPDRFYGHGGPCWTDAIYDVWTVDDERPDVGVRVSGFWADGADRSELVRPGTGQLDIHQWWRMVADGRIRDITQDMARSDHPVESAVGADGCFHHILLRGTERWAGMDGPALYACDDTVTLAGALARTDGFDIRRGLLGGRSPARILGRLLGKMGAR